MDVCVCLAPHHQRSEHRAVLSGVTTPPRPHRVGRRRDASRSRRRSHTRRSRCHRCFCRFSRCLCHHRRRRPRRRPHHLSASWLLGAGLAWLLPGCVVAGWSPCCWLAEARTRQRSSGVGRPCCCRLAAPGQCSLLSSYRRCRSSSARRAFGAARTAATCIASPLDHVAAAWAAAPLGRRRLPVSLPPRRPRPMITAVLVPPRTSSLALWPSPPSSLRWRAGDARVTAPTCGWVVVGSASRKQVCTRLEGHGLSGFPRT